jgi:hypothetical protein
MMSLAINRSSAGWTTRIGCPSYGLIQSADHEET